MIGFARDPEHVKRFAEDMEFLTPKFFGPIFHYHFTPSIWMGAVHPNPHVDNAYYWYDEHDSMDCGLFDWSMFSRRSIPFALVNCIITMHPDLLDAHEDGLLNLFCDEHERYGGKRLDVEELRVRLYLAYIVSAFETGLYLEKDVYPAIPKDQWHHIESWDSDALQDHWVCRLRAVMVNSTLDLWGRRPFRKIVEEFIAGKGAPYFKLMDSKLSAL